VSPRGLACANIWNALPGTDLDALFSALGGATAPSTPFALTFLWDGPQTALFARLAKHIPQTRALMAGPFMGSHRAESCAYSSSFPFFLFFLLILPQFFG
jgi:hypothetical protein